VFDEQQQEYANLSLFPDDREIPTDAIASLQVKLSGLELRRPRLFGSCWLGASCGVNWACRSFGMRALPDRAKTFPGKKCCSSWWSTGYLVDPGSAFRVHRQWYLTTAMDASLGADFAVAEKNRLYRCLDRVLEHKRELFLWLRQK
jgi:hypothetical protein